MLVLFFVMQVYINHRINTSTDIRNNISMNGNMELQTQVKFCAHVQMLSRGCFLYYKLLLDLIEKGHLVLKSSNYKILLVNLLEIFLLLFNLKFPMIQSFEKLCVILNVCLVSLYPLTLKVCVPGVSLPITLKRCVPGVYLPTHPQGMFHKPLALKVCSWNHSPARHGPLPTYHHGMFLEPLILKACSLTHSLSRYLTPSTHPQGMFLYPLTLKGMLFYPLNLKICSSTHSPSRHVPLPTHPQRYVTPPTHPVCFSTNSPSNYIPLDTCPQSMFLYPLALKVCSSAHSPSRYIFSIPKAGTKA